MIRKKVQNTRSPERSGEELSESLEDEQSPVSPPLIADYPIPADGRFDLDDPALYLNRELSWLSFNRRVLHQAIDSRTPLLERIRFVAIVSRNLDEFFMKRIGGLKQQVGADLHILTVDGKMPRQQIAECNAVVRELEELKEELLPRLIDKLRPHGIVISDYSELDEQERQQLRDYYIENIFPLVTPQAMDPAHPFPFISNLSLNLLVTLQYPDGMAGSPARVKVPVGAGIPRFLRVGEGMRFIALEEVISHNLDLLFPGMKIKSCELFRVTRNANTERNEERAEDLLAMIESELRERKFAPIVRMEMQTGMSPEHRGKLAAELGLNEQDDVFEVRGMLAMMDLFEIAHLDVSELRYRPHHPVDHPRLLEQRNIFHIIREQGAILLHHPYESFTTSVEEFLREASVDPKVRAIKMTLYRTSEGTRVIDYLIDAAHNGKQVAVVVELKARFDEEANIRWAGNLEEEGIHVTYGVMGLKTHCKVILVIRQDYNYNKIQRYAHIGTGNYHAGTARLYGDLGILTCDQTIGGDLTELFNYLTTGYMPLRDYRRLLPSPKMLRNELILRIEREMELHTPENPGRIQWKLNALEDFDITRTLYRAAREGVHIDLIIRDTCRLRPGIPGLSDNVRVVSIVGRFLEHSRIYYFRNGGREEYFIGSADVMQRSMDSRVEVVTPVDAQELRNELRRILDTQLEDRRSAWQMRSDGSYLQHRPEAPEENEGSQEKLVRWYEERYLEISSGKKRKTRVIPPGRSRN